MKPKTIYMLMIICGMSLLSAAKQTGSKCDKQKSFRVTERNEATKILQKGGEKAGYDPSPLSLCLFSI